MSAVLNAVGGGSRPTRAVLAERVGLGALMLVIVTLPFAHSIAVRNVALAVALVATAICWRRLEVPRPPLLWFFGGLALLGGLSLLWSIDPAYSRGELKPELLYPPVVYLLAFALCRERAALAYCGVAMALALALSASGPVIAWIDFGVGRPQKGVLYQGAGFYSTWLTIVYPFALGAALMRSLPGRARRLALVLALIALVAGYLTVNRTFPYIAAAETIALLCWDVARRRAGNRLLRAAVAAAAVAALVGGLVLVQTERHSKLPTQTQNDLVTNMQRDVRWALWSEAVERISGNPLHGAGFGRGILRHDLPRRYNNTFLWHSHNTVLNWGLQLGVPGVALLLALFGAALWHLARAYRAGDEALKPILFAACVMVVGLFLKNQTDDLFVRQTVLAFWVVLGAIFGVTVRLKRRQ